MTDDPVILDAVASALSKLDHGKREAGFNSTYRLLLEESHPFGLGDLNIPWAVGPRILDWEAFPLATYPSGLHTIVLE